MFEGADRDVQGKRGGAGSHVFSWAVSPETAAEREPSPPKEDQNPPFSSLPDMACARFGHGGGGERVLGEGDQAQAPLVVRLAMLVGSSPYQSR